MINKAQVALVIFSGLRYQVLWFTHFVIAQGGEFKTREKRSWLLKKKRNKVKYMSEILPYQQRILAVFMPPPPLDQMNGHVDLGLSISLFVYLSVSFVCLYVLSAPRL